MGRGGISRSRKVMGMSMIKTYYNIDLRVATGQGRWLSRESTCHTGLTTLSPWSLIPRAHIKVEGIDSTKPTSYLHTP